MRQLVSGGFDADKTGKKNKTLAPIFSDAEHL